MSRFRPKAVADLLHSTAAVLGLAALFLIASGTPAHAQAPSTSTITIRTTQTTVHEGGLATFILERYGGGIAPLTVQVKTWEPNAESDGSNLTELVHEIQFDRGVRRAILRAIAFVDDNDSETNPHTLNAQVMAPDDGSYQVATQDTATIGILDQPTDGSVPIVRVQRGQSSITEGETITLTFTRTGGDTTQPLTVDVEVFDPGDLLRGDYWDAPPVIPTEVQFGAGSTSETVTLAVPDDGRDLFSDGVTLDIVPSRDYLLWEYDKDVADLGMAPVYVNDNDRAPKLELNFGKDGTNDADVAEGDTLKIKVKRRQQDANTGLTASFTVRVETDRRAIRDYTLAGWKTDYSYTPNRLFKDYELEISGSDLEVEETLQVPENGQAEGDWKYWARILPIVDHEGNQVSDTAEAEYWTVKSRLRETEIDATDSGDLVGTVTLTTAQASVYEGGGVVYTLTRTGGPIGAGRSIGLKTWEPNRESDGSNPSEQTQYPHFPAWETTIDYTVSAYVDGVTEDGTDTLKAELVGNIFYMPGTPSSADDVEIDDPPTGSAIITLARDQASITEGQTGTFTLTRTGGDTTQELTVNLQVEDFRDYLRGNIWDPAPEIPTEATFEANATTATVSLTAPDDQRDLPAAGLITLIVLPGSGYLLGQTGLETSATISATDNDTAQKLSLDWGWLDPTDSSWEAGESYAPCTRTSGGGYECTEGPAEGFYYYEDDRNFRFSHEFEERWPVHFEVTRRAQDTGKTATFVVRVEHNRGWVSLRHADWPIAPETGNHYQEFPLTLTGNQRKVVGRIEVLDNGLADPPKWEYTATIKQIEDVDSVPVTASEELRYWTVNNPRTRTVRSSGEIPFPEFKIQAPNPAEVQEGQDVTFTIERTYGNPYEPLPVQLRTWEPNRTNPDGTNPTEQVHNLTFPAVAITSLWQPSLEQSLTLTVTTSDDAIFETSDPLRIELLSPKKRRGTSVVRGQVAIIDDDQPTITLTADKTSITEGEAVTFTLTRGNNSAVQTIVGVRIDDPGNFLQGDYPGDPDGVETPTSVMFDDGDTTKTITITPPDDRRDIADSSLTFTVETDPGYEILGANTQTVQVTDNDVAPQVQIAFNHDEVEEGEELVLTITRIGEDKNDLEIPMMGGRADDQRFTVIGMDPGESAATLRYRLPDDDVKGPDVEYSFTLLPENLEFWTPTGDSTVSAEIVDNDPYRVSVRAFRSRVDEGQVIYYRVEHDGYTDESLRVNVEHSEDGNAVGDLILKQYTHTIPAGGSGITRGFDTEAGDGSDGDAIFTVELVPSDDYEIVTESSDASVVVVDKDPLPVLRFQNFLVEVREDAGTAEHTLELVSSLPVLRDVSVDYQVQEQFRGDGADIIESMETLTIPAGETTGVIEIPIIQDTLAESDETFFVYLSNPVHTTLQYGVSALRGWGTILDDEPVVSVSASPTTLNEGQSSTLTLTRTGDTADELDVWLSVEEHRDSVSVTKPKVTFAAGSSTATHTITTVNDTEALGNFEIRAYVASPYSVQQAETYHNDPGQVSITVRDTDLPKVRIVTYGDGGVHDNSGSLFPHVHFLPSKSEGSSLKFKVERKRPGEALTVNIGRSGAEDFTTGTVPTSVIIPEGDTEVIITVQTEDDSAAEDHGELTLSVLDGTGYVPGNPDSSTWFIYDNDGDHPRLQITGDEDWVDEGDDVVFTISRALPSSGEVSTINVRIWKTGAAPSGSGVDQVVEDATVTLGAGVDSVSITRTTIDDDKNSGDYRFVAALMPGAYTVEDNVDHDQVWVQDDDRTTVTLTPTTAEYDEGDLMEATFTRTGDTTYRVYVDAMLEITRKGPTPSDDRTYSGDYSFARVDPGESSTTLPFGSTGRVDALGATGRLWLVPDSCPDGSDDCGEIRQPHICVDNPGHNTGVSDEGYYENCGFNPQYMRGGAYQQTFTIYNDFMGVRIEADQTSVAEGTAATFTLHRHGGRPENMAKTLTVNVAVTQDGDYISGATPATVTFAANMSTATLTVPTVDDAVDEMDGSITATLQPQTPGCSNDQYCYAIGEYEGTVWEVTTVTTAVTDDDYIPPNVSVEDATGKEQDGSIEFTISLDAANLQEQATVHWATAEDGTDAATSGTDFTADNGTVTFEIGETEKSVTVTILDDEIDESHETFNLVLSGPTGAALGDDTATGTIQDDELAVAVIFDSASGNVVEGDSLTFRVKRLPVRTPGETVSADDTCYTSGTITSCFNTTPTAEELPNALTVKARVTQEGDVISGSAPTSVTFQPGSVHAVLEVPTVDDSIVEADGVVTAQVMNGSGYSPLYLGAAQDPEDALPTVVRTVYDNDLTISIADVSATEGTETTLEFTVSLNASAPQELTVDAATVDGRATSHSSVTHNSLGKDFTAKSETITFTQGDRTKTFSVSIEDDTIHEKVETFVVNLSNAPHYSTIIDDSAIGTIIDNEEPMVASINRTYNVVNERTSGPILFAVSLSHPHTTNHERNPTVAWQLAAGTATEGEDYAAAEGTIQFEPGEITGFIGIDILDDNLIEAALETFTVELLDVGSGSRLVTLSPTDATYEVHIRDNETLTASIIANSINVVEGQDAVFTVHLTGGVTTVDTMITFELSESDSSKTYVGDDDYGTPIGLLTFPEDDDSGRSGTLTIRAGQSSGNITYPIAKDKNSDEDDEVIEVRIFSVSDDLKGGDVSASYYKASSHILDAGALSASIGGSPTVTEGGTATFTVSLSETSDDDVLVDWATKDAGDTLELWETAEPDSDYTADSGTVTIAAGSASATFTVKTTDDTLVEDTETFVVTLEEAVIRTDSLPELVPLGAYFSTGTITDNDIAPDGLTITATPDRVAEGDGATDISVTVSLDGTAQFTTDTPVKLEFRGRTATPGEDYTAEDVDVVIPAGESSITSTVTFTPLDDDVLEVNERILLKASSSVLANSGEVRIILEDNDLAPGKLILSITPVEADESAGTVSVDVSAELDGQTTLPADVQIDLTTSDGTATTVDDFETATAALTLPAGERSVTGALSLTVVDDSLDESDETLTVTGNVMNLSSLNLNGGLPVDAATFTIRDNDTAPTSIGLSVTGDAITEGGGTVTLTVRATLLGGGTRLEDTTVIYATSGESATLTEDYVFGGAYPIIVIPAGEYFGELEDTITPFQDTLYEGDETVAVQGVNTDPGLPVSYVLLTIQDDDPAPTTIALSVDPGSLSESVGSIFASVTATIEGGSTLTEDTKVRLGLDLGNSAVRSTQFSSLVIPAGEMSGTAKLLLTNLDDDVDDDDETLELRGTTPNPDLKVKSGQLVVTDDDMAGITISPKSLDVIEGGQSVFYAVKLDSQPTTSVTVNIGVPANAGFTVSPESLTFTPKDWGRKYVGVTATDDSDATDEPTMSITHTIASSDLQYRNAAASSVSVTVRDDDSPAVNVSKTSLTIEEGASDTYTLALGSQPAGDVTVTIAGNADTDVSLDKATLTFTDQDWATAQTVTVTAEHDNDTLDEEDVILTHTVASADDADYDGISADSVTVSVTDEDEDGVNISRTKLPLEEGASDTYTVVLGSQPAGDVTVTIAGNADTDVSLDKATLTFTDQNWATAQTVTVTAGHDNDTLDEEDVILTHTVASADDADYDGISADSVTVSVTDEDEDGVNISRTKLPLEEGASDTYTVVLGSQPAGDVTVTIAGNADTDVSLDKATLTFTDQDWATAQTVTVTAEHDNDTLDEEDVTLTHTVASADDSDYDGISADSVSVSVTDEDVSVEFGSATYSVEESDDASTTGDKENEVTVTVTLSADPERTVTIPIVKTNQNGASSSDYSGVPASVTFNSGDTEESFTFKAEPDSVDDDGESVNLTFGGTLPAGVTEGTTNETVVSINDDDLPADVDVEFEQGSYTVAEGGTVSVKVTLSEDPERTVTIGIDKAEQGGASASDYSGVPASVTFGPTETEKSFTFSAKQDNLQDVGEGVKLTFINLPTGITQGTTKETTISITDTQAQESLKVNFGAASYGLTEGATTTVKVTLSVAPGSDAVILLIKADQGGATSSDYSGVPDSLTFGSSDTEKTFTFTATQDSEDDDGESVKLTFGDLPDGVTEGTTNETVISITDDDVPSVTVEFGSATYSVHESDDAATTEDKENEVTVTVKLSADPERTVTIPITKTDQDGASSADYSGVPASVTFNSGDTEKSFAFTATSDTVDDDGESVKLTFSNLPTGVTEGTTKETIVSITDDDDPSVTVEFGSATYSVDESDDASTTEDKENEVTVTVTLSADPERTVTIPIVKTNQDGASSADYSGVPSSVTFNSGDTEKSFTFTATADTVDDDGESVKLTFNNLPTGVTEGTTKETIVSITDDDDPSVTVEFGSATYSVEESDDATTTEDKENEATVTVTLSADPERTVTIPITKAEQGGASSADYSGVPASVTFNSGDTEKSFTFTATSDTVDDDGESVKLTFGDTLPAGVTEGTTNEAVVSINDDDLPADVDVEFEQSSYTVAEGGTVTVKVTLSEEPERTVAVTIVKADQGGASSSDYSGVPASVSFGPTETEKSFVFSAASDSVDDDGESVKLTFNNLPTGVTEGTTKETIVSITDDDVPSVTVEFGSATYSVEESDDTSTTEDKENEVTVTVTLSADPERTVTIPITKTDQDGATSADYSGVPASVVFNSGDTSKSFTFKAESDTVDDDGESVKLTFGDTLPAGVTEGTTNESVVSINDDDLPADVDVEFEQSSYTVAEGGTVTVKVTLSEEPERTVAVTIVKADQDGASSSDYSGVPASVSFGPTETEKSFVFSAASDSVDDDGESVKLTFSNLPTGVTEGTTKQTIISITDDDVPSVTVEFGSATYSVEESDDTSTTEDKENEVTVTVTLSADPERTVTIPITKTDQDGATSADYSGVPASVVFNSGDTSKSFTFKAESDTVDDDGESVKLTFGDTLPAGVTEGTTNESVVSINDDDLPADVDVEFEQSSYTVAEGGTVTVKVTLSEEPERTVAVTIVKADQDGASSSDYSGVPASVSFGPTETEKSFVFSAASDSVDDDGESVKLTFSNLPTGVTEGTTKQTIISITDDDVPSVTVEFGAATYSVDESDDATTENVTENEVTVTVALSADPERTVTIPIVKTDQDGASSADYSGVPASVTFNAWDTEKSFTFKAEADAIDDDGESVKLTFNNLPNGVTEGTNKETIISITDDDVPSVTVEFGSATYSVDESDDAATTEDKENEVTVTVTLSADPERTVTIPIVKTDQDGASSADYSGVPASITFNSGDTEKSFTFTAEADAIDDDGESVKLTFNNLPNGVTEGTNKETIISITDDDVPSVTVEFGSATYSVDESDDAATTEDKENEVTVTVTLSADPERTVTIPIVKTDQDGASSADYSGVPASITFNSGDTEKSFTFTAEADAIDDDGESVKLTFNNLPNGVTEGTNKETIISITDDDVPSVMVEFGAATYSVEESDDASTTEDKENEVVVTVTLSADPERTVTIPIVKANLSGASSSDYSGVPGNVIFNSGDTSKSFTFKAEPDTVDDDGESVKLTFNNLPTGVTEGTTKETIISITDDDVPSVTVEFGAATYSVDESDDATTENVTENEVTVTVTLSADPERTVTIPIVKTNLGGASSSDYSGVPDNVVFNAGDTSKSFTFSATDDSDDDNGESVKLTFDTLPSRVSEATTKETVVSITDDDATSQLQVSVTVSYKVSAYSLMEGSTVTIAVRLSEDPERTLTIPVTTNNGTGASDADYSGVPDNVVFNSGDTETSFSFTATQDAYDEDEETVTLGFGDMPSGVSTSTPAEATVYIRDSLRVFFGASSYQATEGGSGADVTVKLDGPATADIVIPITATGMDGATSSDWTGVPVNLTFNIGDTEKAFTVMAYDDDVEDDGESVQLGFQDLPAGVVEGTPSTATVQLMNTEVDETIRYECPANSGDRIILDRIGEITQAGEVVYWRVRLDPHRSYFIEVLGKNKGRDVMGRDTYPGDLTLESPGIAAVWDDGRVVRLQGGRTHNQFDIARFRSPSGWYEIEVQGNGGTGTYQIKVRVNDICTNVNGYEQYPYFGGPDGYVLDVAQDLSTDDTLLAGYGMDLTSISGFLGDNWSWYRESEPDVDWVRVYMKANHEYTIEVWTEEDFQVQHQATDLKILGIHDSNGDLIAGASSTTRGKKVAITFQPSTDGEYYVSVGSGSRDRTGVYKISAEGRSL